jgi:hypothetical protein
VPDTWVTLPPTDAGRDLDADTPPDTTPDTTPNTTPDTTPDAAPDAPPDAPVCTHTASPSFHYRAEGDADDAVDGQHATFARVAYGAGRFGQAFVFAGNAAPAYVALPPGVGDFGGGDFTLVFWMHSTSAAAVSTVLAKRLHCVGGQGFTGFDVRMGDVAGNLHVELWTSAGFHLLDTPQGLRTNDGRWHQVAVVRRDAALSLNVDGAEVARTALAGRFSDASGTPLYLGVGRCVPDAPGTNGQHDGTAWFEGRLDEVAVLPRAVSPETLAAWATGACPLSP